MCRKSRFHRFRLLVEFFGIQLLVEVMKEMYRREHELLKDLDFGIEAKDIWAAAEVLKSVRTLFASAQWKSLMKKSRPESF